MMNEPEGKKTTIRLYLVVPSFLMCRCLNCSKAAAKIRITAVIRHLYIDNDGKKVFDYSGHL
jgi:hypothetical protein